MPQNEVPALEIVYADKHLDYCNVSARSVTSDTQTRSNLLKVD